MHNPVKKQTHPRLEKGLDIPSAAACQPPNTKQENPDRHAEDAIPPPASYQLDPSEPVTAQALAAYAQNLLNSGQLLCFNVLGANTEICHTILRAMQSILLLPPLAQTLTEARNHRHDLFDHSIRMSMFALYLAIQVGASEKDLQIIATAAIFHDLGMLRVDPTLTNQDRRLLGGERDHLYAHPIIAYLMLRRHPEYHPEISHAVYEHHERLDGSGYPRGLTEKEISFHSQVLMIAEIACTLFSGNKKEKALRLSVILKLNHQKLNPLLCSQLLTLNKQLLQAVPSSPKQPFDLDALLQMEKLATALHDWETTVKHCKNGPISPSQQELLTLMENRVAALIKNLQDAGYDPYSPMHLLIQFEEEPQTLAEIELLVGEALWQILDITHEGLRRSENGQNAPPDLRKWFEQVNDLMNQKA